MKVLANGNLGSITGENGFEVEMAGQKRIVDKHQAFC
jgi:hypothetical protein